MSISKKIYSFLLISLFFLLPIVNSRLGNLVGIKGGFYVNGNYEFTKVMFFNIITGLIITLSFLNIFLKKSLEKKPLIIPKIVFFIIPFLILITLFSSKVFTSFLGNTSKSHSTIMFLNLVGLFVVLINSNKKLLKQLLITSLVSIFFVVIIGIKEYCFPTFDYGNLGNRAFSTFGHPNYLALYILVLIPFLFEKIKNKKLKLFKNLLLILVIIVLFLTKSAWGIITFILYLTYKINLKNKKIYYFILFLFFIIGLFLIYKFSFITKLQSFISRFFIWETTIKIIFGDLKTLLFGSGLGTLEFVFDQHKSPYLYIFENIGFTADRPHNLFLNYFYHLGIGSIIFLVYIFNNIKKSYKILSQQNSLKKNIPYFESIILFFVFCLFNFPGITHYVVIILIGSIIYKKSDFIKQINKKQKNILKIFTILTLSLISIFGLIFSINYYTEEHYLHGNKDYLSQNYLINKINSENYEKNLYKEGFSSIEEMCEKKINYSSSVENYFFCGNLLWNYNKKLATIYYQKGLNKLPDLRDKNSKYNNNFFVKNFANKERFFSEKFSNLNEILERINIKKIENK